MRIWVLALFICAAFSRPLSAAPEEANGAESKITFRVAAWQKGIEEPMRFANGKLGVLPRVEWMRRTGPFEATVKDRKIDFYEGDEPLAGEEGGDQRRVLASAVVPEGIRQPLLLFMPSDEAKGKGFEVLVMEDHADTFPFGSYRFQNFSTEWLVGEIGSQPFRIGPQEMVTLKIPFSKIGDVPLKVAIEKNGRRTPCVETIWTFEPRLRKHVIFAWSRQTKAIEVKSLMEYEKTR